MSRTLLDLIHTPTPLEKACLDMLAEENRRRQQLAALYADQGNDAAALAMRHVAEVHTDNVLHLYEAQA
jgi:hypothetical protein